MATLTLSDILDDLHAAEEGLHKFERRYWLSSTHFYELYMQGLLDDGENSVAFAEWAGHYRLRLKRQAALDRLSHERVETLRQQTGEQIIHLAPAEPALILES